AVGGQEGDGDEADAFTADRPQSAGGEQAASGDTDVVGRDDDSGRRERFVTLDRRKPRAQGVGRLSPVASPVDVDRHRLGSYADPVTQTEGRRPGQESNLWPTA